MLRYGITRNVNEEEKILLSQVAYLQIRKDLSSLRRFTTSEYVVLSPNVKYVFYKESLWKIKDQTLIFIFPAIFLDVQPSFTNDSKQLILIKQTNQVPYISLFEIKRKQQVLFQLPFQPLTIQCNRSFDYEVLISGSSEFLLFRFNQEEESTSKIQKNNRLAFTKYQNFLICIEKKAIRIISSKLIKNRKKFTLNSPISDIKNSSTKNLLLIKQDLKISIIDLITLKKLKKISLFKQRQIMDEKLVNKNGEDFFFQISSGYYYCPQNKYYLFEYYIFITQLWPKWNFFKKILINKDACFQIINEKNTVIIFTTDGSTEIGLYQW